MLIISIIKLHFLHKKKNFLFFISNQEKLFKEKRVSLENLGGENEDLPISLLAHSI